MTGAVKAIKSRTKFNALLNSDKLFFIYFYADGCEPYRTISSDFETIANESTQRGVVEFYKLNIDDVKDVAANLGIQSVPLFYAYKGNRRIGEVKGANRVGLSSLVEHNLTELQMSQTEPFRWFSHGRLS